MHVSAVNVSFTAGDSALIAISTSLINREREILSQGAVRAGDMRDSQRAAHPIARSRRPDRRERMAATTK